MKYIILTRVPAFGPNPIWEPLKGESFDSRGEAECVAHDRLDAAGVRWAVAGTDGG